MARLSRGRLSSVDLLPEEAADDVVWAVAQLNKRERSQADILFELNDRLAVKGIDPISRSAFNRKSMRLSKRAMKLDERRHLYAGLAEQLTPDVIGQDDKVLGEFLKTYIDEALDDDGLGSKNLMELARAYKDTIAAQSLSSDLHSKSEKKAEEKLNKAVDAVTEVMVKESGLSAERAAEIRRQVLGVRS